MLAIDVDVPRGSTVVKDVWQQVMWRLTQWLHRLRSRRDAPAAARIAAAPPSVIARPADDAFETVAPADERTAPPPTSPPLLDSPDGHFVAGSFGNAVGTRAYKLFIPPAGSDTRAPLVVMLHGCKQNPDDFAAGTRMNELAQAEGWFVLYPGQDRVANQMGCWNWFKETDQRRGHGEPSIIADMTRAMLAEYPIDARRVYVAGLSAGGAMAAIMATTYPDLFAAAGIHSGLAHAAASDLASALRAMKQGPAPRGAAGETLDESRTVPTIVFHGDRDTTVHPGNGDQVVAQARWGVVRRSLGAVLERGVRSEVGEVPGGRSFTRTVHRDLRGKVDAEHWLIHGAGHAWAGGSANGSYTDPLGPDASREMLRFFLEHPRRRPRWIS
jgi:poly(hydroxyalkanoate) depolymerase family esterase